MIISHRHKYIFLKTHKTAGTSFQIALSRFCGRSDVVGKYLPADEEIRQEIGGIGPQNRRVPLSRYRWGDYLRLCRGDIPSFRAHSTAEYVRRYLPNDVWNRYYKFCFERNPWDKVVSLYYWRYRGQPTLSFDDFIDSGEFLKCKDYHIYSIDGAVAVDQVFRYEEMGAAIAQLANLLGIPRFSLPGAKVGYRPSQSFRDVVTPHGRKAIEDAFSEEISILDYEWA